ncbi:hypothetical protein DL93DRAFT_1219789 [Clavulina sp. PMI_390]|nr:hypothetical protein DL93DRAFT_1219789 [Clavulina sp. PMI_390]
MASPNDDGHYHSPPAGNGASGSSYNNHSSSSSSSTAHPPSSNADWNNGCSNQSAPRDVAHQRGYQYHPYQPQQPSRRLSPPQYEAHPPPFNPPPYSSNNNHHDSYYQPPHPQQQQHSSASPPSHPSVSQQSSAVNARVGGGRRGTHKSKANGDRPATKVVRPKRYKCNSCGALFDRPCSVRQALLALRHMQCVPPSFSSLQHELTHTGEKRALSFSSFSPWSFRSSCSPVSLFLLFHVT